MGFAETRAMRARSFGPAADVYERGRPPYPDEAVSWLVPPGARDVLDLGAGTGKLTRQLRARGLRVLAVDHSTEMLAQLARVGPDGPAAAGTAEELPVAGHALDAVVVAQAWHWVDPGRAVPEIARVLRPGGQFGLVWNMRDDREPWVAELGRIIHEDDEQRTRSTSPRVGRPFGPPERLEIPWTRHLTLDELLDTVASRSYTITLPAGKRAAILAAVTGLVDRHPALDAAHIPLPYVTRCSRTRIAR